jgi:hypothetical protein
MTDIPPASNGQDYLKVEADRLSDALDQARALLSSRGIPFSTSDLVVCAAALLEIRARHGSPPRAEMH